MMTESTQIETAWCPGCGNHSILETVIRSLAEGNFKPHEMLFVSGIGQAAKAPHYLKANVFNGLHGRALPVATGAKLANPNLHVIVESGDGCSYGEGGNHFLAAIRRNIDLTVLVHDNQVYGLTKGQASPTSHQGFVTKAQPQGVLSTPFNPLAAAVGLKAAFVARGFSGDQDQLSGLIKDALASPGFALIDILTPCVSFNKINTFGWYKQRVSPVSEDYDPMDWEQAMKTVHVWGDEIPTGIIYRNPDHPSFQKNIPALAKGPLEDQPLNRAALKKIMDAHL